MKKILYLFILVLLSFSKSMNAQSAEELLQQAIEKRDAKEYEASALLYEKLSSYEVGNKRKILFLYSAAVCRSLSDNKSKAFEDLEDAIDAGFTDFEEMQAAPELDNLKSEKEWRRLVQTIPNKISGGRTVYYWGMYLGILFILFFYYLFLFFSLRDITYLYFSLMILGYSQFETIRTGQFGFYSETLFVWSGYYDFIGKPFNFFISLTSCFYLLFARKFLNLKDRFPRLNKWNNVLITLFMVSCVVFLFFKTGNFKFTQFVMILIAYLYIFIAGIYCWINKFRPARFFVIAGFLLNLGIYLVIFHDLFSTPFFHLSVFGADLLGQIGFFGLLSFALGDKINILKKEKIGAQEKALEVLEERVKERTYEVVKQKNVVEEKNLEITQSINYALRIQTAILPPQRIVKQYLEDSFILYKPKDIVAGDFYWLETVGILNLKSEIILFAACDCTGHGVPGAMVSVVCHNALNRAVREFGLTQPAAILDKTAEIVIENFSKSEESIKDGMDISLASIKYNVQSAKIELEWAGANNPLWIVRGTPPPSFKEGAGGWALEETKADKQPIGMNENKQPFTNHTFELNPGDTIYLFTDGFADQFGGETGGKKLTKKRFKELILSGQDKPMQEQGMLLDKFITDYRKQIEQIDDILVMGVRV